MEIIGSFLTNPTMLSTADSLPKTSLSRGFEKDIDTHVATNNSGTGDPKDRQLP